MKKQKPLIKQYFELKEKHKDYILMFQVGVFYQMYYYDAQVVSELLGLQLRKRAIGDHRFIPMCGVPESSLLQSAQKIADCGYQVAIGKQMQGEWNEERIVKRVITQYIKTEKEPHCIAKQWEQYLSQYQCEQGEEQKRKPNAKGNKQGQMEIIKKELMQMDLGTTTPIQALTILYRWKKECGECDDRV